MFVLIDIWEMIFRGTVYSDLNCMGQELGFKSTNTQSTDSHYTGYRRTVGSLMTHCQP